MVRINRKKLEIALTNLNDTIHDLGDLSFTYVLNYAKYEGGYALMKYTYDRSKLLRNDYITMLHPIRLSAKEMYVYITGLYNMMCEMRSRYALVPHGK